MYFLLADDHCLDHDIVETVSYDDMLMGYTAVPTDEIDYANYSHAQAQCHAKGMELIMPRHQAEFHKVQEMVEGGKQFFHCLLSLAGIYTSVY